MNVTVIGSYRPHNESRWSLRNGDRFGSLCELLGEELAKSGHFLTVPSDFDKDSADWYCLRGFKKQRPEASNWAVKSPYGCKGVASPKGHIDAVREAQCVIMVGGANGTYAAGMTAIYRRTLVLPLACFGGAAEDILGVLKLPHDHILRTAMFSGIIKKRDVKIIVRTLVSELNNQPRLLIVHGRSGDRDSVTKIINDVFPQLHKPIVLDYSGNSAIGLGNKFSTLADTATGAIVIATPDDIGSSVLDGKGKSLDATEVMKFVPRARENVWLEMGWLWADLGRERILLLVKGDTGIPSDIQDAVRVLYRDDPSEVQDRIVEFIGELQQGHGAPEP